MGIRFKCPNGHSLNVKTFLAGKRAICPECDAKFLVPAESGGRAVVVPAVSPTAPADSPSADTAQAIEPSPSPPTPVAGPTLPTAADEGSLPNPELQAEESLPVVEGKSHVRGRLARSSQRERARSITFALGAFVLLLALVLVMVLWNQI